MELRLGRDLYTRLPPVNRFDYETSSRLRTSFDGRYDVIMAVELRNERITGRKLADHRRDDPSQEANHAIVRPELSLVAVAGSAKVEFAGQEPFQLCRRGRYRDQQYHAAASHHRR